MLRIEESKGRKLRVTDGLVFILLSYYLINRKITRKMINLERNSVHSISQNQSIKELIS